MISILCNAGAKRMRKEYFGVGSLNNIYKIIENYKAKKIFLVSGKRSFETSGARNTILPYLANKSVVYFNDFSVNPKLEDVEKGILKLKQMKFDLIIAVGGGSAIDIAKLINVLAFQGPDAFDLVTGKDKIKIKGLPLIAIPTTSGTGSEATHFAVIYENKVKYSLAHKYILPDYSIIDPLLTYSLSSKLTAISGFDALCQAIESYWAVGSTKKSKKYASQAITLILPTLEHAVNRPDKKTRDTMALAAHYAGKAINISKTTAPHAISYPITSYFGVPHGYAVALTLGKFFLINSGLDKNTEIFDTRERDYLIKTMSELYKLLECTTPRECHDSWYNLMASVGLDYKFKAMGIRKNSDIDLIVKNVDLGRLYNNPVKISNSILKQLFVDNL